MPVLDFQSLMLPALKAFAGGGEPPSEVRERIAAAAGLSAEDVRERLPTGRQSVFVNRVIAPSTDRRGKPWRPTGCIGIDGRFRQFALVRSGLLLGQRDRPETCIRTSGLVI